MIISRIKIKGKIHEKALSTISCLMRIQYMLKQFSGKKGTQKLHFKSNEF